MSTKSQQKPKKSPVTEIAFILDQSGSMAGHQEAAITGFNDFLREQQDTAGKARLTLVLFDDLYEMPIDNIPVSEAVGLNSDTYTPRGTTALLDAIGRTVAGFKSRIKALPKKQRPDQVIFAIFTDGLENASTKYSWADIAKKIKKRQEKDGWEFLFLGANQDAIATAAQMSISREHSATADGDNLFCSRDSSRAMSRKISSLREAAYCGTISADLEKPMEQILREEEQGGGYPQK